MCGWNPIDIVTDIVDTIIDVVVDIVEGLISWIIPIPDIPDFGELDNTAKGVLLNKKSSNSGIPIIYGTRKVGGNVVFLETSGTDNLIGVSGYDTGEAKVGDVLTIPTGTAGATEDRVVDAVTATAISFSAAPTTDLITTANVIRKRAKLYDTEKNLSIVKLPKKCISPKP